MNIKESYLFVLRVPKQMLVKVEELHVAINLATSKEFITFASMGGMTTLGSLLKYQNPEKREQAETFRWPVSSFAVGLNNSLPLN